MKHLELDTSTKDQAVRVGKEEKGDHEKNNLGKHNMEQFTRMHQTLIPVWLLQFIFVSMATHEILSWQQAFVLFLSISLCVYFQKKPKT